MAFSYLAIFFFLKSTTLRKELIKKTYQFSNKEYNFLCAETSKKFTTLPFIHIKTNIDYNFPLISSLIHSFL